MMTKFNVGDKVTYLNGGWYEYGEELTVIEDDGTDHMPVRVENRFGVERWINYGEVRILTPKKSERITALETQVAELQAKVEALESAGKYPLTERFERESAEVDAILADIKRKAKPTLEALLATYPTPNEQRADVIRYAKHYVKSTVRIVGMNLYGPDNRVQFVVNTEKRTVVALTRMYESGDIIRKGIAKCDPDDVFNADIGKAIALARALGVEVPQEFVKAVQPTEVVVGHIVKFFGYSGNEFAPARIEQVTNGNEIVAEGLGSSFFTPEKTGDVITDDTDAVYE